MNQHVNNVTYIGWVLEVCSLLLKLMFCHHLFSTVFPVQGKFVTAKKGERERDPQKRYLPHWPSVTPII